MIMKLYKTNKGPVLEDGQGLHLLSGLDWDEWLQSDDPINNIKDLLPSSQKLNSLEGFEILAPFGRQELWACGVTYLRSKQGRQEESKAGGGADFYAKVYEAERPEIFFKATANRIVGPGKPVRIRKDSTWDVPEPELTLVTNSSGKIIGYTIGNDMSSRSIEGENPLYLPQAKTYDGCAAIGPCILLAKEPLSAETAIRLIIVRDNNTVYSGETSLAQMKRKPEELASWVYRECSFPNGCLIMTGTGIVPGQDFTLQSRDIIHILIDGIGELVNPVA
jgi:2-dehydro-3-deoxy-D-arabinonate dehydratase